MSLVDVAWHGNDFIERRMERRGKGAEREGEREGGLLGLPAIVL